MSYKFIINPITKEKHSINSKKGNEIIALYTKRLLQKGGIDNSCGCEEILKKIEYFGTTALREARQQPPNGPDTFEGRKRIYSGFKDIVDYLIVYYIYAEEYIIGKILFDTFH